ncbi:DNA gyrase subunit B [Kitasatospora sp. NPDC088134]|uniref:DNA gyrase subunit B n=1 Tax=Kitasatospora sp. NPDC088134 TaxID=3364071 RepID=UPI00382B6D83
MPEPYGPRDLLGIDAIRGRPGMFIGTTGERGLHNLVHEAVDPARYEVMEGRARRVEVALRPDGSVRVEHDGGYPVDLARELGRARQTPWPAGPPQSIWSTPLLGVVNALSARLTVVERRNGVTVRREYVRGERSLAPTVTGPADRISTTLTFRPDPELFEPDAALSFDALAERFRELAFLHRAADLTLTEGGRSERFHSPGGLRDYVAHLGGDPADTLLVSRADERPAGRMELALTWSVPGEGRVLSYANERPLHGGTQLTGLRDGLDAAFRGRVPAGPTAVVSLWLDRVELEGSLKDVLGNGPVREVVAEAVREAVEARRAGGGRSGRRWVRGPSGGAPGPGGGRSPWRSGG